jgi:predicted ester cyclase
VRRLVEQLVNKGDLAVVDEIFANTFVNHSPATGTTPDRDGIKQYITTVRTIFPDYHNVIEDLIAEEDRVAVRVICRGTHRAECMGIAPTSRSVEFSAVSIFRFAGGKVVERWNITDNLALLQQLRGQS